MNRRTFLCGLTLGIVAAPFAAQAQQAGKEYRVGLLWMNAREPLIPFIQAFQEGLRDRGYTAGQNLTVEHRFADGKPERLPALAAELAHLKVDVFVVPFNAVAEIAQQASATSPIVIVFGGDPVGAGLAHSLAHPGGNITGLTFNTGPEVIAKTLELMTEALPKESRIAILFNAASQINAVHVEPAEKAALKLGVKASRAEIRSADDLEQTFAMIKQANAKGVLVLDEPLFYANRRRVNDLALRNGWAAGWPVRSGVDAGGLMSYGANAPDLYRRAATYVDKILKGAKPGDLPIEQPTKFELVINLKTAKALGLTIPPSLLLRADQVIE